MTTRLPHVTLTAYNMGDVTETDYDYWINYVCEHIDEACQFEVEVDAAPFRGGPATDRIVGGSTTAYEDYERQVDAIREALRALWDSFCAGGWDEMERRAETMKRDRERWEVGPMTRIAQVMATVAEALRHQEKWVLVKTSIRLLDERAAFDCRHLAARRYPSSALVYQCTSCGAMLPVFSGAVVARRAGSSDAP